MIGDDAVDLLGHPAVEGPKAGLDVRQADVQLRRHERAGQRRVGVAVDQHPVGLGVHRGLLETGEHGAGLSAVRPRPDAQVQVWLGDLELTEENLGHVVVVVLAGVDEHLFVVLAQDATDRGSLDELRSRAYHRKHFHAQAPEFSQIR